MKKAHKIRIIIITFILIASILAFWGLYPFKFLDVELGALIQRLSVNYSIAALALFLSLFILTLLFGRVFCSLLCPFGILQELFSLGVNKFAKKDRAFKKKIWL